jgi:prepilin-type N-terminal cleavage/methylation domain-containing protein
MRRIHAAFTLIEILMALMILAIGLASVLSVFVVGVHASREVVDESAAAVSAKAALSRLLAEDALDDGERDFPKLLATMRGPGSEPATHWVWVNWDPGGPMGVPYSGTVGTQPDDTTLDDNVPPKPVADGSPFSWRCRASLHRGKPGNPLEDLKVGTNYVRLKSGRVDADPQQWNNPDNEELWRVTIQIFRDWVPGMDSLATFDTYVCAAHR